MIHTPQRHIVVAMTKTGLIGSNNQLPWQLPEDLRLFRELTLGGTLVMGRHTYNSIGRPLDQRVNIVVSRTMGKNGNITVCENFSSALDVAAKLGNDIYFIGGGEIYRQALPLADWLHISQVAGDFKGDTYFPPYEKSDWLEIDSRAYDGFTHLTCRRK